MTLAGSGAHGLTAPTRSWTSDRQTERRKQKENKKKGKDAALTVVSQNFNGIMNEEQLDEAHLSMKKLGVGIMCGQEGRRPTTSMTRWDTEELLIAFEEPGAQQGNMKKDGCFFLLSAKWKDAYVRGGKQRRRYCPRLVTIRVPLQQGGNLYLVNVHCPDDSKAPAVILAFQQLLEQALDDAQPGDITLLIGDTNACTGTAGDYDDGVCGEHGSTYLNEAGDNLRRVMASHQMADLLTWEPQTMNTSFFDHRTGRAKQLDRAFMHKDLRHLVRKCKTIPMTV